MRPQFFEGLAVDVGAGRNGKTKVHGAGAACSVFQPLVKAVAAVGHGPQRQPVNGFLAAECRLLKQARPLFWVNILHIDRAPLSKETGRSRSPALPHGTTNETNHPKLHDHLRHLALGFGGKFFIGQHDAAVGKIDHDQPAGFFENYVKQDLAVVKRGAGSW